MVTNSDGFSSEQTEQSHYPLFLKAITGHRKNDSLKEMKKRKTKLS